MGNVGTRHARKCLGSSYRSGRAKIGKGKIGKGKIGKGKIGKG